MNIIHNSKFFQFYTFFCLFCTFAILLFPTVAEASDPKPTIRDAASYTATYVTQSDPDPIILEAGTSKWVSVTFRNSGAATWENEGSRYISAYTMEPRDRASVFYGEDGWNSPKQIGRMAGSIAPGETGELGIHLHAPEETGDYTEEFYLAAENYSWVNKGYFFLKIKVIPRTTPVESVTPVVEEQESEETEETGVQTFSAKRVMQSKQEVVAEGGERIKLILGYQNIGEETWSGFQIKAGTPTSLALTSIKTSFADESWLGSTLLAAASKPLAQFETARETVYFRAPAEKGEYTAQFYVTVDGQVVDTITIPVTVTSNAPRHYTPPVFGDEGSEVTITKPMLEEEPRIKVGLHSVGLSESSQFVSYEDDYLIQDGVTGVTLGILEQRHIAVLKYRSGIYTLDAGDLEIESENYLRLEPKKDKHAVFTLYNYERNVTWKGPNNFNTYRGAMEFRLGEKSNDVWVINDLLFHDYAKGIGENANTSPIEYLKAQSIAQVSYAYAIQRSDKHGIFDVVATTGDQLYLGYENERIMPNFVAAVNAVRGQVVTYRGEVVITPYYAHSDGRTRGWHEVWGGSVRPWLVSVPAKYDVGSRMLGHGVGMSQIDASLRAKNDGWDYKEILEHYYTDTEVALLYE